MTSDAFPLGLSSGVDGGAEPNKWGRGERGVERDGDGGLTEAAEDGKCSPAGELYQEQQTIVEAIRSG